MNCEAYFSFERVFSDHRMVTAQIRLSLRRNKKQSSNYVRYDWSTLANSDICNRYAVAERNRFDILQEASESFTPNGEYKNFVSAHLETAAESVPTKQRAKHSVPSETEAVREKRSYIKKADQCNKTNPTNTNLHNLKKAQIDLTKTYKKEQIEYIQVQINNIRHSVEDRQSRLAWQTVNEISDRKSTSRSKLKATSQKDRLQKWEDHFQKLLGYPSQK